MIQIQYIITRNPKSYILTIQVLSNKNCLKINCKFQKFKQSPKTITVVSKTEVGGHSRNVFSDSIGQKLTLT